MFNKLTLALVVVCAAVAHSLSGASAQPHASAQELIPVGPGTTIRLAGKPLCTVAFSGTDEKGRLVAITAGHCGGVNAPVELFDQLDAGVVGLVGARNPRYDYSVILLDATRVRATNQVVGGGQITELGAPGPAFSQVCKEGLSTGRTCSYVVEVKPDWFSAQVCARSGDSGGPVMAGDKLVGVLSGGQLLDTSSLASVGSSNIALPECYVWWQSPFHATAVMIRADRIMRDIAELNFPGKGLVLPQD